MITVEKVDIEIILRGNATVTNQLYRNPKMRFIRKRFVCDLEENSVGVALVTTSGTLLCLFSVKDGRSPVLQCYAAFIYVSLLRTHHPSRTWFAIVGIRDRSSSSEYITLRLCILLLFRLLLIPLSILSLYFTFQNLTIKHSNLSTYCVKMASFSFW